MIDDEHEIFDGLSKVKKLCASTRGAEVGTLVAGEDYLPYLPPSARFAGFTLSTNMNRLHNFPAILGL